MALEDCAALRHTHRLRKREPTDIDGWCRECGPPWPCTPIRLLDLLAAAEQRVADLGFALATAEGYLDTLREVLTFVKEHVGMSPRTEGLIRQALAATAPAVEGAS